MWGLPQKQNARRAYKIRLCGHLRRYKKIVKKTYIICNELNLLLITSSFSIGFLRSLLQPRFYELFLRFEGKNFRCKTVDAFSLKKDLNPQQLNIVKQNGRLWVYFALSLPVCYEKNIHKVLKAVLSIVTNLSDNRQNSLFFICRKRRDV